MVLIFGLIRFYLLQLEIVGEDSGKVLVSWSPPPPPGNSARDGYKLVVKKKGETKEVLQRKPGRGEDKIELEADLLLPAVEYVFSLYTTARAETESETDALDVNKIRHSESSPAEETFVMDPAPPRDLKLEPSSTSSIKVSISLKLIVYCIFSEMKDISKSGKVGAVSRTRQQGVLQSSQREAMAISFGKDCEGEQGEQH